MTQSRRDLYQAHRLMTQRAALALIRGEPDLPDQPLRRLNVATFASVLVAVIIASLLVILAVLGHGGGPPALGPGSLIIDSQTGTAYVFCEKTKLCPVTNYASARLALRAAAPGQQTLSQDSLTRYPRGPVIGIPGLPQPLPSENLLVRQPWSVCGRAGAGPGGQHPATVLAGGVSTGGHPLGHGAVLMQAGGQDWVVWDGQRMYAPPASLVPMNARQPMPVASALLNALPQGPDLVPPRVPGMGTRVHSAIGPAVAGRVYLVPGPGNGAQYYVLLADGLAQITQTQARLLEAEPGAPAPGRLTLSQVTGHLSATKITSRGLPGHIPHFAQIGAGATVCVVYSLSGGAGRTTARLMTGGRMPAGGLPAAPAPAASAGPASPAAPAAPGVSSIVMPPGSGALVGVAPGGAGHQGSAISYFLVAGGRRYALASKGVAVMLGYHLARTSVLLPLSVAGLIPQGPVLDPAAARRPVTAGG